MDIGDSQFQGVMAALRSVGAPGAAGAMNGLGGLGGLGGIGASDNSADAATADFAKALESALKGVDQSQSQADNMARRFQLGDQSVSLEQTMIAMQKANISFQALAQIRNRVITAYQSIMSMQV